MGMSETAARLGDDVRPLTVEECWRRVEWSPLGRCGFNDGRERPTILPVNHAVDGRSVVFRTVPGNKLAVAAAQLPVSFEVDDLDLRSRSGWSVVIKGHAHLVTDRNELIELHGLPLTPWALRGVGDTLWVRITADEITGIEIGAPIHAPSR